MSAFCQVTICICRSSLIKFNLQIHFVENFPSFSACIDGKWKSRNNQFSQRHCKMFVFLLSKSIRLIVVWDSLVCWKIQLKMTTQFIGINKFNVILPFIFIQLTGHPKSKEWLVSAARANYQELAKLSTEYPELVRLQVRFNVPKHSFTHSHKMQFSISICLCMTWQTVYKIFDNIASMNHVCVVQTICLGIKSKWCAMNIR